MSNSNNQTVALPEVSELTEALRQYYLLEGKSTRTLAPEWGCSHSTVARFLNGGEVTQAQFLRILNAITKPIFSSPVRERSSNG